MNKVINFHDIRSSAWFDSVLTILKYKFTLVSVDELISFYYEGNNLKNACHITFDDGDKTFYEVIFPVLKKHNIPASIFVSPNICIGGKNFWFQEVIDYNEDEMKKIISEYTKIDYKILSRYSLLLILKNLKINQVWSIIEAYQKLFNIEPKESQNMNVDQLLEVDRQGLVVVGAHSENHPILANEDDEKSKNEIIDSIEGLKDILGHEITCFAYPNGLPVLDFGLREMNILKNNNCRIAFSTEAKDCTSKNNPLSIPRYGFDQRDMSYFICKLFFGKYWEKVRGLAFKEEAKARIELERKMRK